MASDVALPVPPTDRMTLEDGHVRNTTAVHLTDYHASRLAPRSGGDSRLLSQARGPGRDGRAPTDLLGRTDTHAGGPGPPPPRARACIAKLRNPTAGAFLLLYTPDTCL